MSTPYYTPFTGAQIDEAIGRALVMFSGVWDLTAGDTGGMVTGLGLSFKPETVTCSVVVPASGYNIVANPVQGSLTSDGFSYSLNMSPPEGEVYALHYQIAGESTDSSGASAPIADSAIVGGFGGGDVVFTFGPPTAPPRTAVALGIDVNPAATTRLYMYRLGEWEAFG